MKIKIANPVGFSRIGGRANNEDAIYPLENDATTQTELFVVCDGMGGHSNGEIASRLASVGFARYLNEHPELNTPISKSEIYRPWDKALSEVESSFENYIFKNPDSKGMGTTLCFLHLHSLGITVGHIGDSRIYQIRGNKVIFKTEDHSRVNELVKSGQITSEEALSYPGKNIITRAIQGANSPTKIEFDILSDIQEGDCFFICTDGVLEQISDRILEEIVSAYGYTLEEKANLIIEKCQNLTKDNYSGYLIEIVGVEGEVSAQENEEQEFIIDESMVRNYTNSDVTQLIMAPARLAVPQNQISPPAKISRTTRFFTKSKDILLGIGYALGGLIIAFFAYLIYDGLSAKDKPAKKPEVKQETKPVKLIIPANDSSKQSDRPRKKPRVSSKPTKKNTPKAKPAVVQKKSEDKNTPPEPVPVKPVEPEKTKVERPKIQNDQ